MTNKWSQMLTAMGLRVTGRDGVMIMMSKALQQK